MYLAILVAAAGFGTALLLGKPLVAHRGAAVIVTNYRGRAIPAAGGLVLMLAVLVSSAAFAFLSASPMVPFQLQLPSALLTYLGILLVAVGFFALGLIDDMSEGSAKGIRGHLGALRKRQVTGGAIKAGGGLALAFIVSALWEARWGPALRDTLIIALTANLVNLLDLRPGRACKFFFLAWIPLAAISSARAPAYLPLSSGLAGAAAAWLPLDLGEKGVLGDAGANMLGGVVGVGIALVAGPGAKMLLLAAILALTFASERFSFSTIFTRWAPLRWLDNLGRTGG